MATHAIVIGGSVAGLFAARVLADHFDRVTILDRDWTPDSAEPRRGVPQGRHAHALLASGLRVIEQFYPGFSADAAGGGAIFGDMVGMLRWYQFGGYKARFDSGLDGILMSRPLLESIVRRHTLAIPNVARVERAHVVGLVTHKEDVTGVLVEDADLRGAPRALEGDLVVDASGRGSAGPAWLRALGYQAPPEELVEIGIGYASRMYRRGATDLDGDGGAVISPHPPAERRLGLMLAVEHDRWAVAIGGFDDHAPSDEAGYLAFAKSLPRPDIYDVIRHAEPLTDIAVHKVPSNRRVHYEKARLPGGYVTVGDAACSFNPMYAQGMTVAALEAEALQRTLVRWCGNSRRSGFARAFYEQASRVIDVPWSMAVQEDLRYPQVTGNRPLGLAFCQRYTACVHKVAMSDEVVCRAFFEVVNLLAPPSHLLKPNIFWRIVVGGYPIMNKLASRVKAHGRGVLAASAIALTYLVARVPPVSTDQRAALAARFAFSRHEIVPTPGQRVRMLADLHIHTAIEPIKAWIVAAGTGVTLADLDADGLPNDLCFTDMRTDSVTVEPVPDGMPPRYAPIVLAPPKRATDQPLLVATGCIAGDINEDGRADLVVYYNTRPPVAYLHTARGYLPQELVDDPSARWSSSTGVLTDLDGDGHLDLMFGAYFPDENRMYDPDDRNPIVLNRSFSHATNGGKTRVLHFEQATQGEAPSVRFRVVEGALPEGVDHGWTLALGAADLDGDLLPEIYAANDFGADHLLYNRSSRGHISFSEVKGQRSFTMPKSKVLGHDSFKSMGVDFADVNDDGLLDIAVSNITSDFGFQESNFVFVNDGRKGAFQRGIAPFRDDSESLGLARSGFTWEVKFGDFDNDGVLEVVHAAGFIKGEVGQFPELHEMGTAGEFVTEHPAAWAPHDQRHDLAGHEPSRFWVRGADGRYVDIATTLGLTKGEVGRALATADVDGDGDLDLAVGNEWEPSYFFRNETRSTAAFLGLHVLLPLEPAGVELHDGHPTQAALARPAIGAEVDVSTPSGRHWVTFVDGSNGHAGKRSPDIHLGLGELSRDANLHVSIRYRNPDGRKDRQELDVKPGWHTVTLPWTKEHASR